jgi:hypothetical protein
MTTTLEKPLKRQVAIGDVDYVVTIDPEGVRLTAKGRRRPEVELRWRDLLSGDAALAVALNASLATRGKPAKPKVQEPDRPARPRAKRQGK